MQSSEFDMLDFHRFLELDQSISPSPFNPATRPPQPPELLPGPNPPPEAHRNRVRNPRSCDFCRSRKTACIIELTPPCTTCKSRGKECVFTERPQKRRRPSGRDRGTDSEILIPVSQAASTVPMQNVSPPATAAPPRPLEYNQHLFENDPGIVGRQSTTEPPDDDLVQRCMNQNGNFRRHNNEVEESLDLQPTSMAFLLGDAGEADPYLLRHPSLAAHAKNLNFRQVYRDKSALNENEQALDTERPLVLMMGDHSLYDKYEPRVEDAALDCIRVELDRISTDVGIRLVMLYFKHIYPYFPVLSRSQMLHGGEMKDVISAMPLSLRAALYASALPYMVYDDYLSTMLDVDLPSAQSLYRMTWTAITHEAHTPHLSTLQSCLLLLQRDNADQYVQCSPFQLSLMAWTVGLAQALGLATDCSTWRGIPAWEKRLRRRLWWATYVLDKWMLLTAGLTTHINDDDFDVLPLTSADFASDGDSMNVQDGSPGIATQVQPHFSHLVALTTILSDMNTTLFSLRASKALTRDFARTYHIAKALRSRLSSWKESFDIFHSVQQQDPRSWIKLDGNVSLGLAYHALNMLLFRALVRPLDTSSGSTADIQMRNNKRDSVRFEARTCCADAVAYLEQIKSGSWNAFWHKFSRSNFAIVSSFMMRLLITSTSQDETDAIVSLISRWRWTMRIGGGSAGSQQTSLGLLRLDRTLLKSGMQVPAEG